jgi:hypothetical protein
MKIQKPEEVSTDISLLCRLLEQKITIFKDFLSVTASLKDMIKEHNIEAVKIMIVQRHDCIKSIDRLDMAIRRFRESNPSYDTLITPGMRKRIRSLTKTLENMINKTLQLNQDCESIVEDELDKLKNDLSGFGHSLKWFKAYGGKSIEPRFLDVMT